MTLIIVVVLVVAWAAVLLPSWISGAPTARPRRDTMAAFSSHIASLRRAQPHDARPVVRYDDVVVAFPEQRTVDAAPVDPPVVSLGLIPVSSQSARERRRIVFGILCALVVVTLLAVPTLGILGVGVHVLADLALAGFVFLALERRQLSQRREVVRPIAAAHPSASLSSLPARQLRVVNR